MRYKLGMDRIKHFQIVAQGAPLASNMRLAKGDTRQEQIADAMHILGTQSDINQVFVLASPLSPDQRTLQALREFAFGKRLMHTTSFTDGITSLRRTIHDAFAKYAHHRMTNFSAHQEVPETVDIKGDGIAHYITTTTADLINIPGVKLTKTVISYLDNYTGSYREGGFLNTHIDSEKETMDIRMVDCVRGSGTVTFADNDFELQEYEQKGIKLFKLQAPEIIDRCWVLPPQSSVVMRAPSSDKTDPLKRPAVHAHGMGQPDGSEERLTRRHDFILR